MEKKTLESELEAYKEEYRTGVQKLKNILVGVQPRNEQEIIDFFKNEGEAIKDEEVKKVLELSKYDTHSMYGFEYVKSDKIRVVPKQEEIMDEVKHRLYLNMDNDYSYIFAQQLIRRCEEKSLPYQFKFSDTSKRDDSFVVYSDDEHLYDYVEILKEFEKDKEFTSHVQKPTILVAPLDDYIGYGTNPSTDTNENRQSFNSVRAAIVEKTFGEEIERWAVDNWDREIEFTQDKETKRLPYKIYLLEKIVEQRVKDVIARISSYSDAKSQLALTGYTKSDVDSKECYRREREYVASHMDEIKRNITNLDALSIPPQITPSGKKVSFSSYDVEKALRTTITDISKTDVFKDRVVKRFNELAGNYNISDINFAVDLQNIAGLLMDKKMPPVRRIKTAEEEDEEERKKKAGGTIIPPQQQKERKKPERYDRKEEWPEEPEKLPEYPTKSTSKKAVKNLNINKNTFGFFKDGTYRLTKDMIIQDGPIRPKKNNEQTSNTKTSSVTSTSSISNMHYNVKSDGTYRLTRSQIVQDGAINPNRTNQQTNSNAGHGKILTRGTR